MRHACAPRALQVYRGIAGMALPKEFWHPNQFGVRGGVESVLPRAEELSHPSWLAAPRRRPCRFRRLGPSARTARSAAPSSE